MTGTRTLVLPLVLLLLGLGAAPAHATLEVRSNSTDGLIVLDQNGLGDIVQISTGTSEGDPVYFVDNNNSTDIFKFDFKQGCSPGSTGSRAVCQRLKGKLNLGMFGGRDDVRVSPLISSGVTTASVNLGSGDNYYEGIVTGADDVFATTGNDEVKTGAGNDSIRVGDGSDVVDAGTGDDDISMGNGTDNVSAGAGNDDIDDTLGIAFPVGGFNTINAGDGNDTVRTFGSAPTANNDVRAGSGDDIVTTGPGDMDVRGDSGNDTITTDSGDDDVFGGGDDDTIATGSGDDDANGGTGVDEISTSSGNDLIFSKETDLLRGAFQDDVRCGLGSDGVVADLKDIVDSIGDPGGGTCEDVDRSPVGETPHVKILSKTLRVSPNGTTRVRLRCPRGVRRLGCKGRLQLRIARNRKRGVQASRSRKVRYRIRAGRRKTVRLRLTRRDVRTLRRRQRRGRKTRGILISVERGRKGRKTTIRNPRLKLRSG